MEIGTDPGEMKKKQSCRSLQMTSAAIVPTEENPDSIFEQLPEEIKENVFKLLAVPDLLICRLVSHKWKNRANAVLRLYKMCFVTVKKPCEDFLKLDLAMKRFRFDVITGLSIQLCSKTRASRREIDRPLTSYLSQELLRFPFKYICVSAFSDERIMCPAAIVVKTILWRCRGSVQLLSLDGEQSCELIRQISEVTSGEEVLFPNLLWLQLYHSIENLSEDMVKFFVEAAPNLKGITYGTAWNSCHSWGSYFQDFCKKITNVDIQDGFDHLAIQTGLRKFVQARPESLRVFTLERYCHASWKELTVQLLMASRNTLKHLTLCPHLLMKVINLAGPGVALPKVTNLDLRFPPHTIETQALVFSKINFGKSLPALQDLSLHEVECEEDDDHEDLSDLESDDGDGAAVPEVIASHAKSISATAFSSCSVAVIQCLRQRFPWISDLSLDCGGYSWDVCEVFASFPYLQRLHLEFSYVEEDSQLLGAPVVDAVLCGLSPEEVLSLQQRSQSGELLLTNLSVVPIRPRLNDLKYLKKLILDIRSRDVEDAHQISEVSGILAFSRIPGLEVFVHGTLDAWEGLNRVAPYADMLINNYGTYTGYLYSRCEPGEP